MAEDESGGFRVRGIAITHPDRKIFTRPGIAKRDSKGDTKGDLARYYDAVAPYMMESVGNYPISLLRCPSGLAGGCFFQRNPDAHMKEFVKPFRWKSGRDSHEYFSIDRPESLIALVQMGVIEFHPWGAKADRIDRPTRIVFDLDPAEGVDFGAVKRAALEIRKRLKKIGLESYPKVTCGKGLHIVVPIARRYPWDRVKDFAGQFANRMAADMPGTYVATMAKDKRAGKIFIDYFRNDCTATAIADSAVRARKGGPVALPIEWFELKALKSAGQFTMKDVLARLKKKKPDLKRYKLRQVLPKAI